MQGPLCLAPRISKLTQLSNNEHLSTDWTLHKLCLFFFSGYATQLLGSQFPDQGLNPGPTAVKPQNLNH